MAVDAIAGVGGLAALVHVHAGCSGICRLVEQLTRERVLLGIRHVILHHQNDVLLGDAILLQNVVGVAAISVVPVVHKAFGADNDHGKVVGSGQCTDGEETSEAKHDLLLRPRTLR